jgi:hypothetical protein
MNIQPIDLRTATIVALAEAHPGFGRTALMKLAYFLQTLHNVPLGYQFRLYTYGPYDGQVLEDLKIAEMIGAVRSQQVVTPVGMGYSIQPSGGVDGGSSDLAPYRTAISAVAGEFAGRSAMDLEMASTILVCRPHRAGGGSQGHQVGCRASSEGPETPP